MNDLWNVEKNIFSRYLSTIQDEIVYGAYFAALCGPAFVMSTFLMANLNISPELLVIAYLIPLIVYSYDYYRGADKDSASNSERAEFFHKRSHMYPYILGCYASALILMLVFFSNVILISFIVGLVMVGVLYTVGLKDLTQKIPAFKNVYTALTWSLAGTFFIPFYYAMGTNLTFILIFLFVFFKCLPNIIFFDLKDIYVDQKEGLKTIPVILGKKRTINLLHALNILAFVPLFFGIYLHLIPLFAASMVLFYFYSVYYLRKSEKIDDKKLRMVSYTLADAEFILWPLVLVLAKFIGF